MWRCWLVHTESPGAPDGYLLVDRNDSWGEQNLMQPPDMVNPNQPIAWLTRLFTFLPDMAHALVSRTIIAGVWVAFLQECQQ